MAASFLRTSAFGLAFLWAAVTFAEVKTVETVVARALNETGKVTAVTGDTERQMAGKGDTKQSESEGAAKQQKSAKGGGSSNGNN